jgi:hypothetical protein
MQPNCVLDVTQSLIVRVSLDVTALERRARNIEALYVAFDNNRQRAVLHENILLRDAIVKAAATGRPALYSELIFDKN